VLAALTITLMLLNQPPAAQAITQTAPLRADIIVTTTIQAAIDAAKPGDTIIVPPASIPKA